MKELKPCILFTIDSLANPKEYTKEELKANAVAAAAAAAAAYAAAAATATATAYRAAAERQLKRYFELTGENKQDYLDKIKENN